MGVGVGVSVGVTEKVVIGVIVDDGRKFRKNRNRDNGIRINRANFMLSNDIKSIFR